MEEKREKIIIVKWRKECCEKEQISSKYMNLYIDIKLA